jgi:imidazolonepropionase-like amidohydrolase
MLKLLRSRNLYASFLLLLIAFVLQTQAQQVTESGKFRLYKFEQPIGEETYETTREGDALVTKSNFKFTDRGSPVPLAVTIKTTNNLVPTFFEIKGNTARSSRIDTTVQINGGTASIREGKDTREASVPAKFFTIAGYAPTAVQQMMMRYFAQNKIKDKLATLPGGEVTIEKRGADKMNVGGKQLTLTRYSISGLIWGRESIWMDEADNLVALVGVDAEFDHFEALREEYDSQLAFFVSKAAEDNMAALLEIANRNTSKHKGALVVTNVNLIDGTGKPVQNGVDIVMENGRITAIGKQPALKIPKGAMVIDGEGRFALPGLWDMHAHFEQVEWGPVYLAAGVTTVRDVGNEFEFMTAVRDGIKAGRGLGPRILLAGIVDGDSPSALGVIRANTPDEARAVVKRYYDAGFNQIKTYSSIKPDILKVICDEAHKLGLTVTGHVPQGMTTFQAIEAGMDQINHIQYVPQTLLPKDYKAERGVVPKIDFESAEAKQAIEFFKRHNTVFDPTLVVFDWLFHPANEPFANFEPGAAKLPRELYAPVNNTGLPPERAQFGRDSMKLFLEIVGFLHKNNLTVVAGTDQVVPGHSLRREIELYVKAGFTPMEAIQAATIVPARVMKMDKDSGTVEPNKYADLILIDGNPLENISNIRNTKYVITNGKIYDCATLWQSVGFKP